MHSVRIAGLRFVSTSLISGECLFGRRGAGFAIFQSDLGPYAVGEHAVALMLSLKLGLQSRASGRRSGEPSNRPRPSLPRNRRIPNSYRNSRLGNFKLEPRMRSWGGFVPPQVSQRFDVHSALEYSFHYNVLERYAA